MERTLSNDICAFAEKLFMVDRAWIPDGDTWRPVRNHPVCLTDWQRSQLYDVFPVENGGRPVVRNYLDSLNKKLGKSTKAAVVASFMAATEPYGEVYVCAADQDQAKDRVFRSIKYAVERGPLGDFATAYRDRIEFSNGAIIQAIPMDFKGAAGGQPVCVIFDELHSYTYEGERRLWDEMIIPPTLPYGVRWVASYAGWDDESLLLKECWDKVQAGQLVNDWPPIYHNDGSGWWGLIVQGEAAYELMPWSQGERGRRFLDEAKESERPASFARLFRNEWVSSESIFIAPEAWDRLIQQGYFCPSPSRDIRLFGGLDLATKHDHAGFVSVFRGEDGRVNLGPFKQWRPPVDLQMVEDFILDLASSGFDLAAINYDPFQGAHLAQRLLARGVNMQEYTQTLSNMGEATGVLLDLITQGRLVVYPNSDDLRKHVLSAHIKESERGPRLIKAQSSKKIDLAVCLAMAVIGAEQGQKRWRDIPFMAVGAGGVIIGDKLIDEDGRETPWEEFCRVYRRDPKTGVGR